MTKDATSRQADGFDDEGRVSSGHRLSLWLESGTPPFAPLGEDIKVQVCVIGAGIAGLTTAYLLSREGLSVAVLDDGEIGSGETGRTTAHLTNVLDDRYFELEELHGAGGAKLAAESHTEAIRRIEEIVGREAIDCEFERLDGYLFVPPGESVEVLTREYEAVQRAGSLVVERVDRAPLASFDTGACLRFKDQAQFHPMKYLAGLASAIVKNGGRIFTNTHVSSVESAEPAHLLTGTGHTVTADFVVVATNTPVNDRVTIHTKQAPYRTYVIGARIPKDSVTRALYWDTPDPYHYVRVEGGDEQATHDILIVGGEDHKTGQDEDADERFANLEKWARERFPVIESIAYRWSGQVLEPVDGMAFIGRNPGDTPNVLIATGDSGNGMTHGTIAGILLTDLIVGRENAWASLYDPSRITFGAASDFVRENLNVAAQYVDLLTPGEVDSLDDIPLGTGRVLRKGLAKIAAYRDGSGKVYACSAVCTHLGCVVAWNDVESSWDCPCHGSRFTPYGEVINGPANKALDKAEL